jgi:hypothetical protein
VCQPPVERDQPDIVAPGDREMQRVGRSQPKIKASDIGIGEVDICCVGIGGNTRGRPRTSNYRQLDFRKVRRTLYPLDTPNR